MRHARLNDTRAEERHGRLLPTHNCIICTNPPRSPLCLPACPLAAGAHSGTVQVNGASVVEADVRAGAGIIHVINQVRHMGTFCTCQHFWIVDYQSFCFDRNRGAGNQHVCSQFSHQSRWLAC